MVIGTMPWPLWAGFLEVLCDGMVECVRSAGVCVAEQGFELGPGFLDGVKVGRVRRQIEQPGPGGLDPLPDAVHFVRAQIVHDQHIAWLEFGAEHASRKARKTSRSVAASMVMAASMP